MYVFQLTRLGPASKLPVENYKKILWSHSIQYLKFTYDYEVLLSVTNPYEEKHDLNAKKQVSGLWIS